MTLAIFGWSGATMASLYTEPADRKRLALEAMAKVQGSAGEQNETTTFIPSPHRQSEKLSKSKGEICKWCGREDSNLHGLPR